MRYAVKSDRLDGTTQLLGGSAGGVAVPYDPRSV